MRKVEKVEEQVENEEEAEKERKEMRKGQKEEKSQQKTRKCEKRWKKTEKKLLKPFTWAGDGVVVKGGWGDTTLTRCGCYQGHWSRSNLPITEYKQFDWNKESLIPKFCSTRLDDQTELIVRLY